MLSDCERRVGEGGEYYSCYVIDDVSKTVKSMYFPGKFLHLIKRGQFLFMRNISIGVNINLREETLVRVTIVKCRD